jgi:uncharacterized protein
MGNTIEDKFLHLLRLQKQIRVMGVDDTPFVKQNGEPVSVAGVVCANTRFEGMLWTEVDEDGDNATEVLITQILKSKFYEQLHLVLLDGVALAGFNVVDLQKLSVALGLPCVTLMRKPPDLHKMRQAMQHVSHTSEKINRMEAAGPIHSCAPFVYQVVGLDPEVTLQVLERLTDTGHVPEALRLAHLIGAAVKLGESTRRA